MLRVSQLTKTYAGSVVALSDFNLEVAEGEFVSLLGASGCGKTTALRAVAGLIEPTGGQIEVGGLPSTGPSRDKALVFQHFNLFPWRSAEANVAYGLEVQGARKRERRTVTREYLDLVGMSDQSRRYPTQLSGGQNQRLGLARALAIQPKLLLMDEPFAALDALTREHLQIMLQDICAQRRLTVLFVTHSIDEAIFLSDRIILMATPGHVMAEHPVPLPKPRSAYDYRGTPEFTRLRSAIWDALAAESTGVGGAA